MIGSENLRGEKMRKWQTKTGSITLAVGGALLAAAELLGSEPAIKLWVQVAGTILVTFGGSLMGHGIGRKIERTAAECVESNQKGEISLFLTSSIAIGIMAGMFIAAGCSPVNVQIKPITEMTPKERATFFMAVYNDQAENYKTLTLDPTVLSDEQKQILRAKKKIMVEVYPLIALYTTYVDSGAMPDEAMEKQIIGYLDRLAQTVIEQ